MSYGELRLSVTRKARHTETTGEILFRRAIRSTERPATECTGPPRKSNADCRLIRVCKFSLVLVMIFQCHVNYTEMRDEAEAFNQRDRRLFTEYRIRHLSGKRNLRYNYDKLSSSQHVSLP
jgi:hypothetical protein